MNHKFLLYFVLLLGIAAQAQGTRKALQAENKKLYQEISKLNNQLAISQNKADSYEQSFAIIDQKIAVRNKITENLSEEKKVIQQDIAQNERQTNILQKNIDKLNESYRKVLIKTYKNKIFKNPFLFILSADNLSQMYRRMQYVKSYAKLRKKQLKHIQEQKSSVQLIINDLQQAKNEKISLLSAQDKEKLQIIAEKKSQEALYNQLTDEQKALQSQIKSKQQQVSQIQARINALIAQEVQRASQQAMAERKAMVAKKPQPKVAKQTAAKTKATPKIVSQKSTKNQPKTTPKVPVKPEIKTEPTAEPHNSTTVHKAGSANFEANKGKLAFPASSGHITQGFGRQAYPGLSQVYIDNAGINISCSAGSTALATFDGIVSSIIVVPGSSKAIILQHGNYFSVYNNLSEIYVSKGQKVNAKQSIGKIYADTNSGKSVLNFQIWKNTVKQNPSSWIQH